MEKFLNIVDKKNIINVTILKLNIVIVVTQDKNENVKKLNSLPNVIIK